METKILGISGRKQSGKNTSANFIVGSFLKTLEIIQGDFKITKEGDLWVPDILGDTFHQGIFNIFADTEGMNSFKKQYLDDVIKVYSYADILKQTCMTVLGLPYEQLYGTDEQKNSLTQYYWENFPGVITNNNCDLYDDVIEAKKSKGVYPSQYEKLSVHEPGQMTAREVMQAIGTEVFRKIYNNVWVDATIKRIKDDSPLMAIICDLRFPNEVDAILDVAAPTQGKVIRLTRNPAGNADVHESETALDDYPLERYSAVIDNREMSVDEQNKEVEQIMTEWEWFPKSYPKE